MRHTHMCVFADMYVFMSMCIVKNTFWIRLLIVNGANMKNFYLLKNIHANKAVWFILADSITLSK